MRPSSSSASNSTQAEYKTEGRAGAESPCEACRYTNVIGHVPPSECTACAVSESVIFWGAAQMLGWMVAVSGGRRENDRAFCGRKMATESTSLPCG